MDKIMECVPNFSEGRDKTTIRQIANAIENVPDVYLLHIDSGKAANRTVMTMAGEPKAVVEAAYAAISTAARLIDMRLHTGTHPRMGATDVCPLVPIKGMTMKEVDNYAHQLAKRCGDSSIPVYMYEYSSSKAYRSDLSYIRAGEYEGLADKMEDTAWRPDYGPQQFQPKSGATVIGAREIMLAYNINLDTSSARVAHEIARDLRASGRKVQDKKTGRLTTMPGLHPGVKAIGWYIEDYKLAQVSMNIVDHQRSPLHEVYESCKVAAAVRQCTVTGSELIGLVPLQVLLDAGKYYATELDCAGAETESDLVHLAIDKLGLNDLRPCDPQERVIEYILAASSNA